MLSSFALFMILVQIDLMKWVLGLIVLPSKISSKSMGVVKVTAKQDL